MKLHVFAIALMTTATQVALALPASNPVPPERAIPGTPASAPSQQPVSDTGLPLIAPSKDGGPPSLFDESSRAPIQTALLTARIHVHHNLNPTYDVMHAYPYPVKPPKVASKPGPMPEDRAGLKDMLLNGGYVNRANPDKPYPMGGWRWQDIYQTAVRKSGRSVPHTMLTMYQWANDMVPYAGREAHKSNLLEDERWERYQKTLEDYERNRIEAENDAVRLGLNPAPLRKKSFGVGTAQLAPGNWWITARRKSAGLTYYWLMPVTVTGGQQVDLELNQNNALVITGGW